MKKMRFKRATVLVLAAMIGFPATLLADDKKPAPDNKPASADNTPAPKGKLADDENPLMIGKRDINKHQLNF